jgi:hypothetical protein
MPKLLINANKIEILDGQDRKHGEILGVVNIGRYEDRNLIIIGFSKPDSYFTINFYKFIAKVSRSTKNQV